MHHTTTKIHRYTITHGSGQKLTILATNAWRAMYHGLLIFGHIGGIVLKREPL